MNPTLRRATLAGIVAVLGITGVEGFRLMQATLVNRHLTQNLPVESSERDPYLLFAEAVRAGAAGDLLKALSLYRQIEQDGPRALRNAARFNSANLNVREGLRLRAATDPALNAQAIPLLELAKLEYRTILKEDPTDWEARFNLERTLRIATENDETDATRKPPPVRDRGNPTTQGMTQGMP